MKKLWRRFLAKINGTFVSDCPRCHAHYYGFQQYKTQVKFERHYRIVCEKCAKEHAEYESKAM